MSGRSGALLIGLRSPAEKNVKTIHLFIPGPLMVEESTYYTDQLSALARYPFTLTM